MQRLIVHGVPYHCDSQNRIYLYDSSADPLCIGTYDPTSQRVVLQNEVKPVVFQRMLAWREQQSARKRKPTDEAEADEDGGDDGEGSLS
jgi:hypothetical protein